ncbi:MAG TPA: hypothetical protein VIJ49_05575 [Aestuariivirga sp.]
MKKPKKIATGAEPDWPAIRARYEARDEAVADIACSIGMKASALIQHAKLQRWAMRSRPRKRKAVKSEPVSAPPQPKPITSTKEAITRLKELVQSRIAKLEQSLAQGSENERGINAANLLARTLEKVLELEEQQRKHTRLLASEGRRRDDAWREELALRLARLARGETTHANIHSAGGEGTVAGLAVMGA